MKFNRRDFLWSSASLAAVAASEARLLAQTPPAPAPAPNGRGNPMNRLNVAVIGFRGRGRRPGRLQHDHRARGAGRADPASGRA